MSAAPIPEIPDLNPELLETTANWIDQLRSYVNLGDSNQDFIPERLRAIASTMRTLPTRVPARDRE